MPSTLPLPRFSTNVRFAASALLFPELAGAWAERLFLTPPRPREAVATALDLIDARASFVEHKGRRIACWTWGARSHEAPAVLLAHGWGGNAAQMRAFAFPLLQTGFRVVAFDQPAHGVSEGRLTGLPDFAEALAEVAWHHGEVMAVVGHSLGASAAALALAHGKLRLAKLVLISPPADLVGYSQRFARWHWMPEAVRRAMQAAIEERYGVRWSELEVEKLGPRLAARTLVVHDRDDRVVPWRHGVRVAQALPEGRLMTTEGLGHRRLLADDDVTRRVAEFIARG